MKILRRDKDPAEPQMDSITRNEWLAVLNSYGAHQEEKIPKGFFQADKLAKMLGVDGSSLRKKIRTHPEIAETKKFYVRTGPGGVRAVTHFRLKVPPR